MAKKTYNTRMEEELIKKFKILAVMEGKRQNKLLEEAMEDLLKKYKKKAEKK
jgi:predicted DNA-binding protein